MIFPLFAICLAPSRYRYPLSKCMFEKLRQNKELWDLFTKKEEYNSPILDKHQRFPYYFSKYRNVLEPDVSKFLIENGLKIEYPEGKKFAVCLTHDIDSIYFSKPSSIYGSAKLFWRHQFKKALSSFKRVFSKTIKEWNPLLNFQEIIEVEKNMMQNRLFIFQPMKFAKNNAHLKTEYRFLHLKN